MCRKGLTLLEVMVASSIFALMLLAVVTIEGTFRRSASQSARESEVYRAVRLAFEHLRAELEGAYVPPFTAGEELTYYPARRAGGRPVLGPSGIAESQPSCVLKVDEQGRLVRLQEGAARVLAFLGDGWACFEMTQDALLMVTLHAERPAPRGPAASEEAAVRFLLRNQN